MKKIELKKHLKDFGIKLVKGNYVHKKDIEKVVKIIAIDSNSDFEAANKVMHPAESGSWAHDMLVKAGFTTKTPPQQGFIRKYEYTHKDGTKITIQTGASADYWSGKDKQGNNLSDWSGTPGTYSKYWGGLEKYLTSRNEK
jgi:hypothetical protein